MCRSDLERARKFKLPYLEVSPYSPFYNLPLPLTHRTRLTASYYYHTILLRDYSFFIFSSLPSPFSSPVVIVVVVVLVVVVVVVVLYDLKRNVSVELTICIYYKKKKKIKKRK